MMVAFGIPPLWPRLSVVQLLLQNKANVDARDMLYRPFHRIVQYISAFLLYCAYDICLCHSDFLFLIHLLSGGTPLHAAATEGYVNVCQLLIDHKADAAAKDMCDPMTLAVRAHDAVCYSRTFLQHGHNSPPKRHPYQPARRDRIPAQQNWHNRASQRWICIRLLICFCFYEQPLC